MTNNMIRAQPASDGSLTRSQVRSWREQGYAFVSGLLPDALITQLTASATALVAAVDSPQALATTDFGSAQELVFPSRAPGFNATTLHENLIRAIADLLGAAPEELRLTQSDLWPKYGHIRSAGSGSVGSDSVGSRDNQDQRVHVDYPNHSLAHPTPWHRPEACELIVYLSDWTQTGGSTALVPRDPTDAHDPAARWPIVDSPGIGDLDYVNDREQAESYFARRRPQLANWRAQLYQREQLTAFKPGDILFYRHDLWHRGTPVKPQALRLAHNITYRLAHAEWINTLHVGWSWHAYGADKFFERLIAESSLLQRAVMGFPQPGSRYWCEETIAAVAARYAPFGMDMAPYQAGQH